MDDRLYKREVNDKEVNTMPDEMFDTDVFISYAHIDNQTMSEEQKGWISMLHRALKIRLDQLLGETAEIWRDQKLGGNDEFGDEIVEKLTNAAVLVAVLSPRYVKSEWCNKEVNRFLDAAVHSGGVSINNKSRIFKVIKTPVDTEKHPIEILNMLGYEFYKIDPDTNRAHEYVKGFGSNIEPEFWDRLEDLAIEISQMLQTIEGPSPIPPSGITVYLAETSSDLSVERDLVRRELQACGHNILPNSPLPLNGSELDKFVKDNLEDSTISIHLIGNNYGAVPEEADLSMVEIQNSLAVEHSQKNSKFSQLIWMPLELKPKNERQKQFVDTLQNDITLQGGDELLQTSIGDLKAVIQDKLEASKTESTLSTSEGATSIYLLYDQSDSDDIKSLDDYLFDNSFEIVKPLFDNDDGVMSKEHQENLSTCDAVLIYYGCANEVWLRKMLRDLKKAPGYRSTPMKVKAIYVAGPENNQKTEYRTHEVDIVIKNFGDFSPDNLTPFLDTFKK